MAVHGLWRITLVLGVIKVCHGNGGTFKFKMMSYSSGCGSCDIRFKFCFDKPRDNGHSITTCEYMETPESNDYSNTNNIGDFGSSIRGIPNPMVFQVQNFIDRRVVVGIRLMDENIFSNTHIITTWSTISFTPAANASVATSISGQFTDSGHTFGYQYMAYCNPDYYGTRCATFCIAGDSDALGHYTCDAGTGWRNCLAGWQGFDCNEDVDECQTAPNICNTTRNTTCVNTHGSYWCDCAAGWKGENCQVDVDECQDTTSPLCFNGGNCSNTDGSYRCNCTDNWSGPSCTDDVDECATLDSPCTLPNTRCTNTQGGYVCNCTEAWKGDSCTEDVDECEEGNITCHNNGTCVNNEGGYRCHCSAGWTGPHCTTDVDECQSSPCLDSASCNNTLGSFQCICTNGTLGCLRPVTPVTTSAAPDAQTNPQTGQQVKPGENKFLWWPIVLVVGVLLVVAIVFLLAVCRRKRKKRKNPRRVPPGMEVQHFKASALTFENTLYNVNKVRTQSSSSDPQTRAPMPLPDLHQDDPVIYHDADEEKVSSDSGDAVDGEKPYPCSSEVNSYANIQEALDVRPSAGETNQYQDFEALTQNSERPSPSAPPVDVDGYTKPVVSGSVKRASGPDDVATEQSLRLTVAGPRSGYMDMGGYVEPSGPGSGQGNLGVGEGASGQRGNPSAGYSNMAFQSDDTPSEEATFNCPVEPAPAPPAPNVRIEKQDSGEADDLEPHTFASNGSAHNTSSPDVHDARGTNDDQLMEDAVTSLEGTAGEPLDENTLPAPEITLDNFFLEETQPELDTDDHFAQASGELDNIHHDVDDYGLQFVANKSQRKQDAEDHVDIVSPGETTTDDPGFPAAPGHLMWQYPEYEVERGDSL